MNAPARRGWQELRDRIRGRILEGRYTPGGRLPRDSDLAREFGCARSTVQRAMAALAEAGLVERRRRGGTRVRAEPPARAVLTIPVVREEVEARGAVYGYQLIGRGEAPAPAPVAARLGLAAGRRLLHVEALHLADRRPFMVEDRWIDPAAVPGIEAVDLARVSANEWLLRNRPYSRLEMRFFARAADRDLAARLDCAEGAALFVSERSTWAGEVPITTVQAVAAPGYALTAHS